MTTQLTFWAVNNLYHSPNSSYNEQAQEAFASKSMMRLLVPDALVGHIVDQLDAMVERGSDPDYDFDASDFDGAEVTPDHYLLLTVKQAVMFLRFLERDIHIADATDAQKRNFVSAYERIMKQTLVVMPDTDDPTPAPDTDDTSTDSDTDVATEPTPADNDPAPVLAEIMDWVAWNVENFGADGTYHSVDLLPNISLDGLDKWLRVRKGVVHFRLAWWRLLAQDNPAVYHAALRNIILKKAELSKVHSSLRNTSYAKKQRLEHLRLSLIYQVVSRYKYGVE